MRGGHHRKDRSTVKRMKAPPVFLVYMAGDGFLLRLTTTIYSVFAIVRLGLDPLQLVLLGTVLETTYLIFEIPTGVVADTIGRRFSVIVGVLGSGAAFFLLGFSHSFKMAAVSQVLWGIFATFQSGADVAWLTDEVGEAEARRYYLKGDQYWYVAAIVGIVGSVALASIDLGLPIVVTGIGFVALGIWLAVTMPEEHFHRRERGAGEGPLHGFVATLGEGIRQVRAHHVLLLILGTAALHGASTEGFDRLSDFHLLKDVGLPAIGHLDRVVWFGILDGVALLLALGAVTYVKHKMHLEGHAHVARILAWIDVALIASVVVFGVTHAFPLALAAFWVASAMRGVREPIFTAWINQGLDPATRATINSMGNQSDAVGQALGGPVLGIVGNRSVPSALVLSGLLRAPALLLYARAVKRGTVGTVAPREQTIQLEE
jgi:DHA3 family tetracycline resistance protein-like MFS transporter